MRDPRFLAAKVPSSDDPWLTTKEAARYLNCHPNTLEKMRCRGDGPRFYKFGSKAVRYKKSDLDAFLMGGGHDC